MKCRCRAVHWSRAPPDPEGPADGAPPVARRRLRLPRRSPALQGLPRPVAPVRFSAPPSRFIALGSSRPHPERAFARPRPIVRLARPRSLLHGAPSAPGGAETGLLGFLPLRHMQPGGSGSSGASSPGTFRPQGFDTLPAACSPPSLATAVAAAASMGFSLQGFAPPGRPHPSRGPSSPVVSPSRRSATSATPEASSVREGVSKPVRFRARLRTLALLGVRPSRALASDAFPAASRHQPLLPFDRDRSLRYIPGLRSRGLLATESAGLSRGCRPSWDSAPSRAS
jgi:hypothetical protein